jgi:hypothetical protein
MNRTPIVDREIPDRLIVLGKVAWFLGFCAGRLHRLAHLARRTP